MSSRFELVRLGKRSPQQEEKWDQRASDQQRDAPAPTNHLFRPQPGRKNQAKECSEHDGHLLAPRLPAHEKSFASRSSNLCEINARTTNLDSCRESLEKAANDNQQRRKQPDH